MYIRERKTEYEKQELLIAKGQKDSDHLRRQRDELQDTRKYGSFLLIVMLIFFQYFRMFIGGDYAPPKCLFTEVVVFQIFVE